MTPIGHQPLRVDKRELQLRELEAARCRCRCTGEWPGSAPVPSACPCAPELRGGVLSVCRLPRLMASALPYRSAPNPAQQLMCGTAAPAGRADCPKWGLQLGMDWEMDRLLVELCTAKAPVPLEASSGRRIQEARPLRGRGRTGWLGLFSPDGTKPSVRNFEYNDRDCAPCRCASHGDTIAPIL